MLTVLPFIVRVPQQHRRDHSGIEHALESVLLSDEGEDALARSSQFDTSIRRKVFELLTAGGAARKRHFLNAALKDPDAVIRARTIPYVANAHFEGRIAGVFPQALLDRAARARLALVRMRIR